MPFQEDLQGSTGGHLGGSPSPVPYGTPVDSENWHSIIPTALCCFEPVNPKVVRNRLGHSAAAFTLQVYGHVLPAVQDEAVRRLEFVPWKIGPDAGMGRNLHASSKHSFKTLKIWSRRGDSNSWPAHYECVLRESPTIRGVS